MSAHAELDPLEATKFDPPRPPPGWIPRGRLTDELDVGFEHPLTLLAAGAGAGKSALVSSWIAQRPDEVAVGWLSLDRGDADRRRFWRAVLKALKRGGAPEPVASLSSHPSETVEQVIALWHAASSRAAQALRHAAAASDWDLVGALAGEHWVPLLLRGELGALGAALAQLPHGPARRDPEVNLAVSGVQLDAGDEAGSALFEHATEARERVPEPRRERFDLPLRSSG